MRGITSQSLFWNFGLATKIKPKKAEAINVKKWKFSVETLPRSLFFTDNGQHLQYIH